MLGRLEDYIYNIYMPLIFILSVKIFKFLLFDSDSIEDFLSRFKPFFIRFSLLLRSSYRSFFNISSRLYNSCSTGA
jgi:hypothetical protein